VREVGSGDDSLSLALLNIAEDRLMRYGSAL